MELPINGNRGKVFSVGPRDATTDELLGEVCADMLLARVCRSLKNNICDEWS
jgi:hypothetical protein